MKILKKRKKINSIKRFLNTDIEKYIADAIDNRKRKQHAKLRVYFYKATYLRYRAFYTKNIFTNFTIFCKKLSYERKYKQLRKLEDYVASIVTVTSFYMEQESFYNDYLLKTFYNTPFGVRKENNPYLNLNKYSIVAPSYRGKINPKLLEALEESYMPTLPEYLQSFVTAPSEEIVQRHVESRHLFNEVMRQARFDATEITRNNNMAILLGDNFASHPNIHRGYYDYKRNGKLYVKDAATGQNIPKEEAVLLSNGTFLSKTNSNIISMDNSTHIQHLMLAKDGGATALDWLQGKWMKPPNIPMYIPANVNMLRKCITSRGLADALQYAFREFVGQSPYGVNLMAGTITQTIYDEFKTWFNSYFVTTSIYRSLLPGTRTLTFIPDVIEFSQQHMIIPNDADFFKGFVVTNSDVSNFGLTIQTRMGSSDEYKPNIVLFSNSHTLPTGVRMPSSGNPASIGTTSLQEHDIQYNFPIVFRIALSGVSSNSNRRTGNNEGNMLSYSARVPEYKESFLMTKEERRYYDGLNAFHKQKVDKWLVDSSDRKDALREKIRNASSSTEVYKLDKELQSLKPPAQPASNQPIYLGFELEACARGDRRSSAGVKRTIKEIADSAFGDHVIIKSDASTGSYGFEIVSIPATLKYHKDMLENHFFDNKNNFGKAIMSTEQCGFHVHISKQCLTRLDVGKMIQFINSPSNAQFITDISGREQNSYCVRQSVAGKNRHGVDVSAKAAHGLSMDRSGEHYDRRMAVNLRNAKTIEIRMFKSSNNKNNVLRKLEFCEALVKFVRSHSTQQMTVYDFVEFLLDKTNKHDYHNMVVWLASKNYIGHQRKQIKDKNKIVNVYGQNKVTKPDTIYHKEKA